MRGYLSLALIAVYFGIAFYLEAKAWRHFKPGVSRRWYSRPLLEARLFSEKGQRHRDRAISFYVFGGLTLLVFLILLRSL